ncbi:hypothetical protein A943_01275 [Bacillus sp. CPSM8]|nr:hypothetical protein A943_01275 [Bacillus sp. CPSM8]
MKYFNAKFTAEEKATESLFVIRARRTAGMFLLNDWTRYFSK